MNVSIADPVDLREQWQETVAILHYAMQPVVNIHTGSVLGYEALLRNTIGAGFSTIAEVFETAYQENMLLPFTRMLLEKAYSVFQSRLGNDSGIRLFFNIDNRIFEESDDFTILVRDIESSSGRHVCLEISEQTPIPDIAFEEIVGIRNHGHCVALDDFGTGYSGLKALYRSAADIIKIDRFFISDIDSDATKSLFVTNLVSLAHTMGVRVIAEGIETDREFYMCRDIGCDSVQGFLVCKPDEEVGPLPVRFPEVATLVRNDRRREINPQGDIESSLVQATAIHVQTSLLDVLKRFRIEPETTILPVVTDEGAPIGILREHDLKAYVYNPYGISLLMNKTHRSDLYSFVKKVPIVNTSIRLKELLEIYGKGDNIDAILVTEEGRYRGFLDSHAVLQIVHNQELAYARDQNPLTQLPGNTIIDQVLSGIFAENPRGHLIVYFDLNEFKPFNDRYGFRHGDRVIQLFADLLKDLQRTLGAFVGHIGGDDFFVAWAVNDNSYAEYHDHVSATVARFSDDVRGFYEKTDADRGFIIAKDREGIERRFGLLTASAAVIEVPAHDVSLPAEEISCRFADVKKLAKNHESHIWCTRLPGEERS